MAVDFAVPIAMNTVGFDYRVQRVEEEQETLNYLFLMAIAFNFG